jgi:hypothetical protein
LFYNTYRRRVYWSDVVKIERIDNTVCVQYLKNKKVIFQKEISVIDKQPIDWSDSSINLLYYEFIKRVGIT